VQLDGKARTRLVSCTGKNPLSWNERLVYSLLVFLRRHNRGGSCGKVARETGLNRQRTVPRAIRRLAERGLVEDKDGRWWATEPPEPGWFGWVRNQDERPWWQRLAYWWLYFPGPALTLRTAAVWSMSVSCQRKMQVSGLARLLNMDRNTVRQAAITLTDQGLFHNMRAVLPDDKRSLFRDRPIAALLSTKYGFDGLPEALEGRVNRALDGVQARMQREGWSNKGIETFMTALYQHAASEPTSVLLRVILDLPRVFDDAQKEHECNQAQGKYQKASNCKGLLAIKVKRHLARVAKAYRNSPVKRNFLDF
jgi:predicted DNA-binding transcriptional regulator